MVITLARDEPFGAGDGCAGVAAGRDGSALHVQVVVVRVRVGAWKGEAVAKAEEAVEGVGCLGWPSDGIRGSRPEVLRVNGQSVVMLMQSLLLGEDRGLVGLLRLELQRLLECLVGRVSVSYEHSRRSRDTYASNGVRLDVGRRRSHGPSRCTGLPRSNALHNALRDGGGSSGGGGGGDGLLAEALLPSMALGLIVSRCAQSYDSRSRWLG